MERLIEVDASAVREPQPLPPPRYAFPHPSTANVFGVVGMGGDFAPETIVDACVRGIFPWPHDEEDYLWFSPDPRGILPLEEFHVSRRMRRTLRQGRFHVTIDRCFDHVLAGCAEREEGTWVTPRYQEAYRRLHELGWAHSFEAWTADGELAGGVYGIVVGGYMQAESMFTAVRDGSKAALTGMMQHLWEQGFALVDVQVTSPHVERLGAVSIPREQFLERLATAVALPVRL
ncbi:MAG: leucyl/phenylalanyl-tRNA--protein transferase [Dehalococcoidia bacterium]|nr:leucyl/phenylalanyl-tRNA--protein transferase [Dehalococcoidia bacterium]